MTIEVQRLDSLTSTDVEVGYGMYERRFAKINELAAQRHLMTRPEFVDVAADRRVTKYLAYNGDDDRVVGMSTLTNQLDAMPLLSPAYYARKFPDEYARGDVWYVGFVCAARPWVFDELVDAMFPRVVGGIVAMDFCTVRQNGGLHIETAAKLERLHPGTTWAAIDTQTTFAYRFDGKEFE